jgi:transcriptional regulator with XRE-family HTH domain
MNFGKAFKIIRSVKNLEQQQLAVKLGVDSSYISLIESGRRTPSANLLGILSKRLSVPRNLIILLASEKDELNTLEPHETEKIGEQLLNILISTNQHE